ncbi:kinase-like domain-containing protein [Multifurca ochricompacta]|uniref:Kinase-like domain-containing protein n=1 Tax=Multifurca ochricompacta TaxID=376703 RepID=A0AAD4MCU2_9AGAM|nr:kinase-like domain-containing protein [Multifurca ochricompacta]
MTDNFSFIGAVQDEWQLYSDRAKDYSLGPPIGFGSSSIVYHATYHPKSSQEDSPIPCALKVLDLDRLPPGSLRLLQRETQLMSLSKHPNVLRVRGSWLDGHKLHIALRLMNAGSAADVMQYAWPGGMEEEVVRCILKQTLEGLNYLHINGFIHRDIKAANLLIDDDGTVLLGDLGVAAPLNDEDHAHVDENAKLSRAVIFDAGVKSAPRHSKVGKRRSFVGTPCWMAPELISGIQYDSSADIWSFGITALELAQGRAPRSRESSRTVLLHIVQAAPPTLDREGGVHKYSRAFKEVVERCLVKDPSLRPTAEQLLQTPFFRNAKKRSYLVGTILRDLPPLAHRLERRKQPSLLLHGTIDSWDFPTTLLVPSPTQTVLRWSGHTSLEGHKSINEQDEKGVVPNEQTDNIEPEDSDAECLRSEMEHDTAHSADSRSSTSESALSTHPPSKSDASTGTGCLLSAVNSGSLSPKTSTNATLSTSRISVVSSSSGSPSELAPSLSLWRRIRRSTGHSKDTYGAGTKHAYQERRKGG